MIDFGLESLDELQQSQDAGIAVAIKNPSTGAVLFHLTVAGPDSRAQARAIERTAEEAAARGNLTPMTREENEAANVRFLARCCIGWDLKHEGNDLPFTEDNAVELLTRYKLVREAVNAAAQDRNRFIKRS